MPRWPLRKAYLWQEAPFLRLLPPLVAGILCYDQGWLKHDRFLLVLALTIACGLALATISLVRNRNRVLDIATTITLSLAVAGIGWCMYYAGDVTNRTDWLGNRNDTTSLQLVRIAEAPQV